MAYKKWLIVQIHNNGKVPVHTNGNGHSSLEYQLIDGHRHTCSLKQYQTVFTKEGAAMKPWKLVENNHNLMLEDNHKEGKLVTVGAILYTEKP